MSSTERRRSLFLRGYDRVLSATATIEKDARVRTSSRFRHIFPPLLFFFLCFFSYLLFSLGMSASSPRPFPSSSSSSSALRPLSPRLKVAIAITVTKDGPYLDGAAVLQHSVRMTRSKHDLEMVAIVHSTVQSTRPALQALGFRIMEFPLPVLSENIEGKHLRETIDKSGCCGAQELLKLCSWQLLEYDRVVAMDMDAIWLSNLDHLLEKELLPGGFLFTYDFAMDGAQSRAPPVQGGFQLLRPDQATFEELVRIVHVGDFRPGTGWGGLNIGWCWGGQTIQGLLSYFANAVKPDLAHPLDPCVINSMATTKTCRRVEYAKVESIHYTYCQKPWECHSGVGICAQFLQAWWMVRNDLERMQQLDVVGRCCSMRNKEFCPHRTYHPVEVAKMHALPMNFWELPPVQGHIVELPANLPLNYPPDVEDD